MAAAAFGLAISTNMSKKAPVAPSAKNHSSDGLVTPALSWPAANGAGGRRVHRALDDDRDAVQATDHGRDVGRREARCSSTADRRAGVRRHGDGLLDRRAGRQQVADAHLRRAASGSGSGAGRTGRTRRASPLRPGTTSATAPATLVSAWAPKRETLIPAHRAIDHHLDVRLEDGRDVGGRQPGEQPQVDRPPRRRRQTRKWRTTCAGVGLEAEQDARRRRRPGWRARRACRRTRRWRPLPGSACRFPRGCVSAAHSWALVTPSVSASSAPSVPSLRLKPYCVSHRSGVPSVSRRRCRCRSGPAGAADRRGTSAPARPPWRWSRRRRPSPRHRPASPR